jgi:hypothetical protein
VDRSTLDSLMRAALAQLALIGSGGVSRYDRREPAASDGGDGAPAGARDAPQEFFRRRYENCRTDEQRRTVVLEAVAELRRLRRAAPTASRRRATPEEIARDTRHVGEIAEEFGISEAMVYKLRQAHARRAA